MNVELAQAATVFDVLCVRLQRLWLLLMAVYRLGNISTQIKFWKMISMQFVQVRSQNRSVPSRGGRYGKNIISILIFLTFHDFITVLCHVSFTSLSEQYCQTNFPIIKTKPFKETQYKSEWWIFRPKWAKIKNLCHYFIFVMKK